MHTVIHGHLDGKGKRFAVAVGRFNELVTSKLLGGALDSLVRHGVTEADVTVVWAPGAFELPLVCRWLAASGKFDGIVALGAVIRGATSHYDLICAQAARGILDAGLAHGVPVSFGVLTCDTLDQAMERAGSKAGNKGADAAIAALEMASLRAAIGGG